MSRKMPTILILLVMVLLGAMYWVDLTFYTDPVTGFVIWGPLWMRYAVLALPVLVALLGLPTVGKRAIATLRMPSRVLGGGALFAGICGFAYGVALLFGALWPLTDSAQEYSLPVLQIVFGALLLWHGVWMALAARQLATQKGVAPTKSALFGILAALPFCAQTVVRVLVQPTGLYRVGPFVQNFSALFSMLWFAVLLHAFYVALTRNRVRWMYMLGIVTFLLSTCLEMVLTLHTVFSGGFDIATLLQGVNMGAFGLFAGMVSVSIAAQKDPEPQEVQGLHSITGEPGVTQP